MNSSLLVSLIDRYCVKLMTHLLISIFFPQNKAFKDIYFFTGIPFQKSPCYLHYLQMLSLCYLSMFDVKVCPKDINTLSIKSYNVLIRHNFCTFAIHTVDLLHLILKFPEIYLISKKT